MTLPDAPAAIRELCRRRVPDALAAMFRSILGRPGRPGWRQCGISLVWLRARVISINDFDTARAAANLSRDELVASVCAP
jgi:hypothetical protein